VARVLITWVLLIFGAWLGALEVRAQRGATGPVADLNAEAKALHESDPARSLVVAQQALTAARAADDRRGEAEALNYVAYAYRQQSLLDLARQTALESVRLFVEERDTYGESQGYNTLGLIEADDGRFPEAMEYHLKALAIRERTSDKEGLSYSFNNLGNAFRNMGEYEKALDYHAQGLALKVELGNRSSEAYSHHNMGLVYFAMGDYPQALEAYRRGLAIREALDEERGIAVSLNAIGSVEALTRPAAALRTYERALELRRATGDERGEMATELNLGDVYRRMGDMTSATAAFQRALELGRQIDAPLMASNALKALAEVEAARGDYRAAYEHQVAHQAARDVMFNQQNAERLQRLQVAHEAERQAEQILALQQQGEVLRTTRTALVAIAVLVAISSGLLFARFRLKHQSEMRLRAQADALTDALDREQTLKGLLPICASCKKIRDDSGYWMQVERYVAQRSAAEFTHSICPSCFEGLYPEAGPHGHTHPPA
jgi:tetratricopeptide (TPR) repeat protein